MSDPSPIRRILCFNSMESLHMCVWWESCLDTWIRMLLKSLSVSTYLSPSSQVIKILRDHFALKRSVMKCICRFPLLILDSIKKWNSRLELVSYSHCCKNSTAIDFQICWCWPKCFYIYFFVPPVLHFFGAFCFYHACFYFTLLICFFFLTKFEWTFQI